MKTPTFPRRDAMHVYLLLSGGTALFYSLVFTVNMVYQATVVDLNAFQLVLVGTTLEATAFAFEVPTGVVADVYSRRLSIIVGCITIGVGFLLEGLVPRFGAVLLAQVLWGVGYTFTSGATEAWITDEIGEEQAGRAFLRAAQVGQIAGLVAMPVSVVLGSVRVALPIALGGALFVLLGVGLALVMPETGFTPVSRSERTTWHTLFGTLREGLRLVRGRRVLITILAISAVVGLHSEGLDRLWTPHLLDNFTFPAADRFEPVVWFGFIGAVSSVLAVGGTELVRRRLDTTHPATVIRTQAILMAFVVAGIAVFALARGFWLAVGALWITQAARSVGYPIFSAWLNQHIESGVRATMFSVSGQLNAVGQIAGGPGVGYIGTVGSLRLALMTSALLLSPALVLLARLLRQSDPIDRAIV